MRVLVIGGSGFIGSHVVQLLCSQGHTVAAFHRADVGGDLPDGVAHILGERQRLLDHREPLLRFEPDVVIDMRAMNEDAAKMLVDVFRGHRVIVASSIDVYRARDRVWRAPPGPPDPVPLDEDGPLRDTRFPYRAMAKDPEDRLYYYDKIPVEELVLRELGACVLRLPAVHGPRDHRHRAYEYLQPMIDGRPAVILEDKLAGWRLSHAYAVNVAEAIRLAAVDPRSSGRIYNVGDGITEREWVERIAAAAGWRGRIVTMATEALPPHLAKEWGPMDFSQDWVVSTRRIREELGYREIVPEAAGMHETVAWETAHPPAGAPERDYAAEDAALAQT